MPLKKDKSEASFEYNLKELMEAGHSQKQSLAIAYKIKRGEDVAEDAEFKESDHPRAANGEFGSGGSSSQEKKKVSTASLKEKLERMPHEKLLSNLRNPNVDLSIKKHIEKELDDRANRGTMKGHGEDVGMDTALCGAGVLYVAGNSVLLGKRSYGDYAGHWDLPGGKAEGVETPEQTAMRESQEEVGYAPLSMTQIDYSDNGHIKFTTFVARVSKFEVVSDNEHSEFVWADLNKLPKPLHPCVAITIEKYKAYGTGMDLSPSARQSDINGYTEIKGNPLSKVGIFPYAGKQISPKLQPDKIYMVYRPEEELSHQACIESFKLIPWVEDHTMLGSEENGLTPPEQKGVQGVIGEEVYFKNGVLYGNLKLFSENLGELIESGEKRDLSCGYRCRYEIISGTYNGKHYDVIQRDIRGNHLASVTEGRMGPDVAVLDNLNFTFDAKEITMPKEDSELEMKKQADKKSYDDKDFEKEEGKETEKEKEEAVGDKHAKDKHAKDKRAKDEEDDEEEEKRLEKEDREEAKEEKKLEKIEKREEEGKDDKHAGMDAAISELRAEVEAFKKTGIKSMLKEVSARNELAGQISQHVGAFDHAEMTLSEVASYGVKKIGLEAPKGQELTALRGFFHGRKPARAEGIGMDASVKSGSAVDLNKFFK